MNSELLSKAAAYCSASEHCVTEVTDKLLKWGADSTEIPPIIDYLLKEKYIDENRYCRAFVNDKLRFAKWGRQKIAYMLSAKRVDKEALAAALDSIDEEQYQKILIDLLKSKLKTIRTSEPQQLKLKLYRFAASRGFEASDITKAIKNI